MAASEKKRSLERVTHDVYCNRKGISPHQRFFLKKMFKSLKLTEVEWASKLKPKKK